MKFPDGMINPGATRAGVGLLANWDGWLWREEFRNGSTGLVTLASSNSGGASNTTVNPNVGEDFDGCVALTTGATASANQRGGLASNLTHFYPGDIGNIYYFGARVRSVTPPTGTDTGYFQFGFSDVISSIGSGACGFRTVDAGNWQFFTANGGIETTFDTGISNATTTTFRDFSFILDANNDRMTCYVDGIQVAVLTTNVNKTTNRAGLKCNAQRVAATTANLRVEIDYVDFGVKYKNAKGVAAINLR